MLLGRKFVFKSKLSWTSKINPMYYDTMLRLWEKKLNKVKFKSFNKRNVFF